MDVRNQTSALRDSQLLEDWHFPDGTLRRQGKGDPVLTPDRPNPNLNLWKRGRTLWPLGKYHSHDTCHLRFGCRNNFAAILVPSSPTARVSTPSSNSLPPLTWSKEQRHRVRHSIRWTHSLVRLYCVRREAQWSWH